MGLLVGIVSAVAIMPHLSAFGAPSPIALLVVVALVLSLGIAAFILNEVGSRASNNYERLLFGFSLGCLLYLAWISGLWPFLGVVVLVMASQFATVLLLRRLCVLDRFVNEYLEGTMEGSIPDSESPAHCGQLFCTCNGSTLRTHADSRLPPTSYRD